MAKKQILLVSRGGEEVLVSTEALQAQIRKLQDTVATLRRDVAFHKSEKEFFEGLLNSAMELLALSEEKDEHINN